MRCLVSFHSHVLVSNLIISLTFHKISPPWRTMVAYCFATTQTAEGSIKKGLLRMVGTVTGVSFVAFKLGTFVIINILHGLFWCDLVHCSKIIGIQRLASTFSLRGQHLGIWIQLVWTCCLDDRDISHCHLHRNWTRVCCQNCFVQCKSLVSFVLCVKASYCF